jgi:predicted Fe-Mo cluster-binding NifX family protein
LVEKKEKGMRIVVSAETNQGLESQVAHHFGRCPFFALVEVADKNIESILMIENPFFAGHQPGQVPGFIHQQQADVMISGGMGGRAIQFFNQYDIRTASGASGTVKNAVNKFLEGKLPAAASCAESAAHGHGQGHNHEH